MIENTFMKPCITVYIIIIVEHKIICSSCIDHLLSIDFGDSLKILIYIHVIAPSQFTN